MRKIASPTPFVTFKVRPKGGRFFFRVIVFDTKEQMREWWAQYDQSFLNGDYDGHKFGARMIPYEITKGELRHSDIGTIIISKEQIGAGTLVHELGHASIWYDRLIHGNSKAEYGEQIGEAEERMLYLLADLTAQSTDKLYKYKVY